MKKDIYKEQGYTMARTNAAHDVDNTQSGPQSAVSGGGKGGGQSDAGFTGNAYAADMAAERTVRTEDSRREQHDENVRRAVDRVRSNPNSPTGKEPLNGEGDGGKGKGAAPPQKPTGKGQQQQQQQQRGTSPLPPLPGKWRTDLDSDFSRRSDVSHKPVPESLPSTSDRVGGFFQTGEETQSAQGSVAAAARSWETKTQPQNAERSGRKGPPADEPPGGETSVGSGVDRAQSNVTAARWRRVEGENGQLQIIAEQLQTLQARLATMQVALDKKDETINALVLKLSAREAQAAGVKLSSHGSASQPEFDEEAYEDRYMGDDGTQQQHQQQRQQREQHSQSRTESLRSPEKRKLSSANAKEADPSKEADPFEEYDPWGGKPHRPERYRPRAQEMRDEEDHEDKMGQGELEAEAGISPMMT